jgi:hypothetical protein
MAASYRQSLLSSYEQCPRRALHGMAIDDDLTVGNVGASADLGSAFHAFAAEYLRTLWRQNEPNMPTQEAVEIAYEILAHGTERLNVATGEVHRQKWVLPSDERDDLIWMVLGFCRYEWQPRQIMPEGTDLDRDGGRLSADIVCPDGVTRTLTGQPDVILADPPDGIVIVDHKSGKGKPKAPRSEPDAEIATGKQYLSERGHFQLDSYGLLGLRKYPQAQRAILRELHLRSGKTREAVLGRDELEHVERQIGLHLMLLDEARALFEAGESETHALLRPRPGSWCARKCPVAASCPVPAEQRGVGALDSDEAADAAAGRYVVVDGLRQTLREQLRTYYEEVGRPPMVGDGTGAFWRPKANGRGRDFGIWPLEDLPQPEPDEDMSEILEESIRRVREARA